jgi:hypothetical protein
MARNRNEEEVAVTVDTLEFWGSSLRVIASRLERGETWHFDERISDALRKLGDAMLGTSRDAVPAPRFLRTPDGIGEAVQAYKNGTVLVEFGSGATEIYTVAACAPVSGDEYARSVGR